MADTSDSANVVTNPRLSVITDSHHETAKEPFPEIGPFQRTSQQTILPAAVKRRNTVITFAQLPDPDTSNEPFWFIGGPVAVGEGAEITWVTQSGSPSQGLFAMSLMSFYFSESAYDTYRRFLDADQWPNDTFNMRNIPCTFWQDEAMSTPTTVVSRQSFRNDAADPLYYMGTLRLRILSNSDTIETTTLGSAS